MAKQTEAPIEESSAENLEENPQWVSKSQLKRESHALQDLGKKLSSLNEDQLNTIPMEERLRDALQLAQKLNNKRGALKRHYQYIGKLLRSMETDPLIQAVAKIEQNHQHSVQAFKRLENWRDEILEKGDAAIQAFCQQHEGSDRQKLRQLWRNHQQAQSEAKKTHAARQLFKALRESQESIHL